MKPTFKYDPEDIESLLLHKQFRELYPEEKEFILRHIESEEEYESLRKTLFELRDARSIDEWIEPDAALKSDLLAEFGKEEKGRFAIWLNSLFAMPQIPWYRQRGYQMAFASIALIMALVFFYQKPDPQVFAELNSKDNAQVTPPAKQSGDSSSVSASSAVQEEEQSNASNIPPAPIEVAMLEAPVKSVAANEALAPQDELKDAVVDMSDMNGPAEVASAEVAGNAAKDNDATFEEVLVAKQSASEKASVPFLAKKMEAKKMSVSASKMSDVLETLYTAY